MPRYVVWAVVLTWSCGSLEPAVPGVAWAVTPVFAGTLDQVLRTGQDSLRRGARAQRAIDDLDDAAREMLEEHRRLQRRIALLRADRARLQERVRADEARIAALRRQLDQVRAAGLQVPEMIAAMARVLEDFVAADLPFLTRERGARLERLETALENPALGRAQKYRRLLEVYGVELDYGRTVEVYRGPLDEMDGDDGAGGDGSGRTVDFLRLGRTGLFYRTLDAAEGRVWDPGARVWVALDKVALQHLDAALDVARDRAAPRLLILPLPAAEAEAVRAAPNPVAAGADRDTSVPAGEAISEPGDES